MEHAQHVGMHEEHVAGARQDHAQGVEICLRLVVALQVARVRIVGHQTAQEQRLGNSEIQRVWGYKSAIRRVVGVAQAAYRKPISKIKRTRPRPARRHPNTLIEAFSRLGVFFFLRFFSTSFSHASLSLLPRRSGEDRLRYQPGAPRPCPDNKFRLTEQQGTLACNWQIILQCLKMLPK